LGEVEIAAAKEVDSLGEARQMERTLKAKKDP
jgi:hypothetical protein